MQTNASLIQKLKKKKFNNFEVFYKKYETSNPLPLKTLINFYI